MLEPQQIPPGLSLAFKENVEKRKRKKCPPLCVGGVELF